MVSPPPTRSMVTRDAVASAVDALLKWTRDQAKHHKAQLLEHDDLLYLVLTIKRIPSSGRTNPYRIPIPHPLHPLSTTTTTTTTTTSICLFVDDRPTSSLSPSAARDRARSDSFPVAEIIGLSDLRSDYRPFEARRRLCDSHDLFFADRRIIPLLPRLLGKHFFKKKKIPLPVDFSRKGWPEQIRQCCNSTLLYLRTGTCSGLKVGRVSQARDSIVDNVMAAIDGVIEHVPKKWGNIRSLHIKSVESLALPIYQAVPELGLKIEGLKHSKEEPLDGEVVQAEEEEAKRKPLKGCPKKSKKGRIHEVQYMDMGIEDLSENDDSLQGGDDAEENEEEELEVKSDEEKKNAKLKKAKIKKGKRVGNQNAEEDENMQKYGGEEDASSDELGIKKREHKMKKQQKKMASEAIKGKNKKSKKIERNDEQVHLDKGKVDNEDDMLDDDGEEENVSDKLSVKKRKKDKTSSGATANKLKEKDAKKTKKSKVRHGSD